MATKNFVHFAGKNLKDFNLVFQGSGTYGAPARDVTMVKVPGKNGALTIDAGTYANISVKYHVGIKRPVDTNMRDLRNFLLGQIGYQRLEDSYHPEEYRLGVYEGGFEPTVTVRNRIATADISFNCKPQRFLKAGEIELEFTSSGSLFNPYPTVARPLVRVYGTGQLTIGDETITISAANQYTDIDCDLMDAFKGTTNCNANITLNSGDFFHLDPEENGIILGTGITKVIITPRWYIL